MPQNALDQVTATVKKIYNKTMSPQNSLMSRIDMVLINFVRIFKKLIKTKKCPPVVDFTNAFSTKLVLTSENEILTAKIIILTFLSLLRPQQFVQNVALFNLWFISLYIYREHLLQNKRQVHPAEVSGFVFAVTFVVGKILKFKNAFGTSFGFGVLMGLVDVAYRIIDYGYRL
ncbi:Hypothetical_protein [Hexamita inflata]|uniref:Hypothetical_protein n=1 Tax=Hexamita inflata TaxID=28002 RepID=A0ABP1H6A5_9EUKA